MKDFIDRVEKGLIRFVVISMVILVVVQGFMSVDPIRLYLSWGERMEGEQVQLPAAATKTQTADPDVEEAVVSPKPDWSWRLLISHPYPEPRSWLMERRGLRLTANGLVCRFKPVTL